MELIGNIITNETVILCINACTIILLSVAMGICYRTLKLQEFAIEYLNGDNVKLC